MIHAKKIAIFGFGKEGISAANYLGRENEITIIEEKPKIQIDPYFFENLKVKNAKFFFSNLPQNPDFNLVIRSPGARPDHPKIKFLTKNGALQTSTTKIFFDACPGKIIGVTGTKGKGTTSTLIFEMLKKKYKKVYLAGNIGTPTLDILDKLDSESLIVLELSSFQLLDLQKSPHIAVVLMISSEHLDWHKDSDEYQIAKESIVKFQSEADFSVINHDFEISRNFANKTKSKVYFFSTRKNASGAYIKNSEIISEVKGKDIICRTSDVLLPGKHNLQNILAAITTSKILDVENRRIAKVIKTFKGLIHRLQLVDTVAGVSFYNDSFSTTPETTIAALEAFKNPKILILGGSSKKSDFSKLAQKIHKDKTIKTIILIGAESPLIKNIIAASGGFQGKIIEGANNMHEIVRVALQQSKKGDVVLLSPACASFDMFKNYQDRGEQFIEEVRKIKR